MNKRNVSPRLPIPAARRIALTTLVFAVLGAAHAGDLRRDAEAAAQVNFAEYFDLLRLRNVPDVPADMARNAEFLERAFERRGFRTRLVDNPAGRPGVIAELDARERGGPTVMFYLHYDGQPVMPEEWSQPDPFEPVLRRADEAGHWADVAADTLQARPLDPELRVFARAASDDKAPIMMLLTAVDLLRARGDAPAFDLKVLLDAEEEIGSPSLAAMVAAEPEAFRADALVVLDGPEHALGRPTLVFGNRGITKVTLTVFGARTPLHSGHFGNYAPNPAERLAALLASLKDDAGRVLVPGFYDGVELTDADRAMLAAVGDDEPALLRRIGIARPERVGRSYQEALQYPSLNVRGLAAAGVGALAANIIPSEAIAEIDMRTTPETDGHRLYDLVRRHIEAQGYRLVDGVPSDEERARYSRLASFTLDSVQAAMRTRADSPLGRWALGALQSPNAPQPEVPPVRIRMMGGTVPTDVLAGALHVPFILVPTVNGDNNQHARDENLRMGNFVTGTETVYALLTTPYFP
jgi:acetylornithine deacetylase/succinyl-diaminopimelate desuccinylase-like protein